MGGGCIRCPWRHRSSRRVWQAAPESSWAVHSDGAELHHDGADAQGRTHNPHDAIHDRCTNDHGTHNASTDNDGASPATDNNAGYCGTYNRGTRDRRPGGCTDDSHVAPGIHRLLPDDQQRWLL